MDWVRILAYITGTVDQELVKLFPCRQRTLVFTERFFYARCIMDDPTLDGAVVYGVTALLHEFLQVAIAERIGNVPPHTL